jgi:hypothetical protein
MDQIEQFNPPPNPTKLSDARANGYLAEFGEECWELDALNPSTISSLIKNKVTEYLDVSIQNKVLKKERKSKGELELLHTHFYEAVEFLVNEHTNEAEHLFGEDADSDYSYEENDEED